MRKVLTALIAAVSIGAAAITTSSSAKAWWGWGPAVAGGVVAGAIVGGALAARPLLPVLRLRTVPLLRAPLSQRLERLRLGTCLLVTNRSVKSLTRVFSETLRSVAGRQRRVAC